MKGLQKVVRLFQDAEDNPDSHQNLSITFCPIYNVTWNLHANSFCGICITSAQVNSAQLLQTVHLH